MLSSACALSSLLPRRTLTWNPRKGSSASLSSSFHWLSRKGSSASLSSSKIKSKCPVSFHCVEKRKLSFALFFQDTMKDTGHLDLILEEQRNAELRFLFQWKDTGHLDLIQVSSVLPLCREKETQHRISSSKIKSKCPVSFLDTVSRKGSSASLSSSKIKSKCPVSFHCVEKRKLSIALFSTNPSDTVPPLTLGFDLGRREHVQCPSIVSRKGSSVSLSSFQEEIQVSSVLPLDVEKRRAQHRSLLPRSNLGSVQCPSIVSRKGSSASLSSSKMKCLSFLVSTQWKLSIADQITWISILEKRKLSFALFFQDQIQVSSVLPLCREKEAQHRSLLPRSNPSVQCPSIVSEKEAQHRSLLPR